MEPDSCEDARMPELKDRLKSDLSDAMRARDELRTATVRMALTAITNEEVSGKAARQLSDDEVIGVLTREVKKRREAAEAYDGANRPELAQRERAESEVLQGYLPAQLSDAELTALIDQAVEEARAGGSEGMRAMGVVMKTLQPKVAGRADGAKIAAEVKARLGA